MAAIVDYGTLQAAIVDYLSRPDLNSKVPTFINLADRSIKRRARLAGNTILNRAYLLDINYPAIPTATGGFIKHWFYNGREIMLVSHIELVRRYGDSVGPPEVYAIVGCPDTIPSRTGPFIKVAPKPPVGVTYSTVLEYWDELDSFGTGTMPNAYSWFLRRHPELYLYGSLLIGAAWLKDDPRVPRWKQMYDDLWREVQEESTQLSSGHGNDISLDMVLMNERN